MVWANRFVVCRGGFVKPADGKPAHAGRGFYPGQSVKHGSDHRANALVPSKGPPASNPFRTSHQHPRPLPHLNLDNPVSHINSSHSYTTTICLFLCQVTVYLYIVLTHKDYIIIP